MKTAYFSTRGSEKLLIDSSTGKGDIMKNVSTDIDWLYVAPEDMSIRYTDRSGNEQIITANKGDLIVQFYDYSYIKNRVVVIKNNKWKENMISKEEEERKNQIGKEVWASKKCCECCDCGSC